MIAGVDVGLESITIYYRSVQRPFCTRLVPIMRRCSGLKILGGMLTRLKYSGDDLPSGSLDGVTQSLLHRRFVNAVDSADL